MVRELEVFAEASGAYLTGEGAFPERAAVDSIRAVHGRLLCDGRGVGRMGVWRHRGGARQPPQASPERAAIEETVNRARGTPRAAVRLTMTRAKP